MKDTETASAIKGPWDFWGVTARLTRLQTLPRVARHWIGGVMYSRTQFHNP